MARDLAPAFPSPGKTLPISGFELLLQLRDGEQVLSLLDLDAESLIVYRAPGPRAVIGQP